MRCMPPRIRSSRARTGWSGSARGSGPDRPTPASTPGAAPGGFLADLVRRWNAGARRAGRFAAAATRPAAQPRDWRVRTAPAGPGGGLRRVRHRRRPGGAAAAPGLRPARLGGRDLLSSSSSGAPSVNGTGTRLARRPAALVRAGRRPARVQRAGDRVRDEFAVRSAATAPAKSAAPERHPAGSSVSSPAQRQQRSSSPGDGTTGTGDLDRDRTATEQRPRAPPPRAPPARRLRRRLAPARTAATHPPRRPRHPARRRPRTVRRGQPRGDPVFAARAAAAQRRPRRRRVAVSGVPAPVRPTLPRPTRPRVPRRTRDG